MICLANQLSDSCMMWVFVKRCFRRDNNLLLFFSIYCKVFSEFAVINLFLFQLLFQLSKTVISEKILYSEFSKYFVV